MKLNEPLDEVHQMSIEAVREIRRQYRDARRRLGLDAPRKER